MNIVVAVAVVVIDLDDDDGDVGDDGDDDVRSHRNEINHFVDVENYEYLLD